MVNRHHLHKTANRECLSDGNYRLVLGKSLELAHIQHDGCVAVCKPSLGNNRRIRPSCNLQYRQGSLFTSDAVVKVIVDYDIRIQHGRKRQDSGQRQNRAYLEKPQVRGYLS